MITWSCRAEESSPGSRGGWELEQRKQERATGYKYAHECIVTWSFRAKETSPSSWGGLGRSTFVREELEKGGRFRRQEHSPVAVEPNNPPARSGECERCIQRETITRIRILTCWCRRGGAKQSASSRSRSCRTEQAAAFVGKYNVEFEKGRGEVELSNRVRLTCWC